MNVKTIKLPTVVLNFPNAVAVFIIYARAIYLAMFENVIFVASAAKVANLFIDITALEIAEAGFKRTRPTHTISERNVALEKVKADLRSLRNDVQELANADPVNAESIIESSGMSAKDQTLHGKQQNTAKDGIESGSVDLTAEGAGPHQWRISTDEITWTLHSSSSRSRTTVRDLKPGVTYYFQNQRILPNDEECEWSQSVKIMVR
ncbi:MAG: hypothetical protein GZ094_19585 [Mariniphaga sp.]|nr:hypothetical protein [Mariniphaga sp.]